MPERLKRAMARMAPLTSGMSGAASPMARGRRARAPLKLVGAALLCVGVAGVLGGCAGWPQAPTYTDAELKAMCERRGGWWRGDLIAGYCEFQAASLSQSP